jgi:hypothetical protein
LKRDAIAGEGSSLLVSLEPLHGRRGHRRRQPLAVLQHLARRRDPQRVGAQICVEDGRGDLDPFARILRIGIPFGDDHAAARIALRERCERQRLERRPPQIGVDADLGGLARGEVGAADAVPGAAAAEQLAAGEGEGAGSRQGEGQKASHVGFLGNTLLRGPL